MSEVRLLDKQLGLEISQDKMNAYLYFYNPEIACEPFGIEEALVWLRAKGIIVGVDVPQLMEIAANPQAFLKKQTCIATGERPVDGADGRIEYAFELEREKRPVEVGGGKVDYREVNQLLNVRRGQLIARKLPPMEGQHGQAVTGEVIHAKSGKEARFKIGKNVLISPEGDAMYAAIDGMVTRTDRDKLNVFPVYEVNGDVDYGIGNIDFVGTVVIRGNVLSGFKIRAAGDIRVNGGVEGAELEAGGSIELTGGIVAGHKGIVKAGKNIKCPFIQDANVIAGEDVLVSLSIMHSSVRAGRNVICQGAKGLLVGGVTQAGEKVTARMIGNAMSTATVIEVGVLPEQREKLSALRGQLRELMQYIDKTEKALNLLNQMASVGQLSNDKMAMRIKLSATHRQSIGEQQQMKMDILEIEKTLEDTDRACVEVQHTIYGGTKIVIGRYTRFIKEPTMRAVFRYEQGDIVISPYH